MNNYSYLFDVFGKTLRVHGDWPVCLKDLSSWYEMPQIKKSGTPDFALEIRGVHPHDIDKQMPLPADQHKKRSGIILVNEKLDYSTYTDGHKHWTDYAGAGRIRLDFSRGSALSLVCENSVFPTYQKYLFADHPLDKLFSSRDIFSMHASCASINGKGIAFTGNSGAGKSTAAFALLQKGLPIITDEKLLVLKDAGYFACSISDIIKVRDDAMSKFFSSPDCGREYDVINGEHYIKLGGSNSTAYQNRVPLKVLCLLEQTGQDKTEIHPVSPTKLVGGLFPVTITAVNVPFRTAKFHFIMDMLEKIECRLIRFGTDMDDFAAKVEKLAEIT
jgi:hypothetical protein